MSKERTKFAGSTLGYLIKDEKVLFLKFSKKWGQVYAPPGGKMESGETPANSIMREFEEETGAKLINPKIKGIVYWDYNKIDEGFIYIFTADDYIETILDETREGKLNWIPIKETDEINQFEMNAIFNNKIYEDGLFEGEFHLDENNKVLSYKINNI